MEQAYRQHLIDNIRSYCDSHSGQSGTWIYFMLSELKGKEVPICKELVLEQMKKNGKEVWFTQGGFTPIVARGHFELDEAFWSK